MQIKIIDDTGILELRGARTQNLLLEYQECKYKINIKDDGYEQQSLANLYMLNNNKDWTHIKQVNLQRDYKINISHSQTYNQNSYKKIIDDFKKLIIKLNIKRDK